MFLNTVLVSWLCNHLAPKHSSLKQQTLSHIALCIRNPGPLVASCQSEPQDSEDSTRAGGSTYSPVMWLWAGLSCLPVVPHISWYHLWCGSTSDQNESCRLWWLALKMMYSTVHIRVSPSLEQCRKDFAKVWVPGGKDAWRTILELLAAATSGTSHT